nr:hypothetical protein [Tanacetum cinerariifolium]
RRGRLSTRKRLRPGTRGWGGRVQRRRGGGVATATPVSVPLPAAQRQVDLQHDNAIVEAVAAAGVQRARTVAIAVHVAKVAAVAQLDACPAPAYLVP